MNVPTMPMATNFHKSLKITNQKTKPPTQLELSCMVRYYRNIGAPNGCTLPRPSIFGPHELVPIFGPHELVPIFGPHELVPIFGPYESITIFGPYESITIFGPYFRNIFSIIFFNSLIHNLSIECDSCGKIFLMLVI